MELGLTERRASGSTIRRNRSSCSMHSLWKSGLGSTSPLLCSFSILWTNSTGEFEALRIAEATAEAEETSGEPWESSLDTCWRGGRGLVSRREAALREKERGDRSCEAGLGLLELHLQARGRRLQAVAVVVEVEALGLERRACGVVMEEMSIVLYWQDRNELTERIWL